MMSEFKTMRKILLLNIHSQLYIRSPRNMITNYQLPLIETTCNNLMWNSENDDVAFFTIIHTG